VCEAVIDATGDVRVEERPDPTIIEPTDAIVRVINPVWNGQINPGKVFDLTLPIEQVADGYRAMDERRAIKALLRS
jgi:threonine dehydrogenase-like Zn-dependent dehydrogenase